MYQILCLTVFAKYTHTHTQTNKQTNKQTFSPSSILLIVLQFLKRPQGKGKFQSTDNKRIRIKRWNSFQKKKKNEVSDERRKKKEHLKN